MSVNVLYRTEATATGGRDGHSATKDGAIDVKLVTPKELGGAGGDGVNPEQLFATGYTACLLGAIKYAAAQQKVKVAPESSVTAQVGIGPRADETGFGLEVDLKVSLPGLDRAVAEDVMQKGHIVCPYSNATQNNIKVTIALV